MKQLGEYATGASVPGTQWPQAPQKPKVQPQFTSHADLHRGAQYGPHICPECWSAGWRKNQTGELVRCGRGCGAEDVDRNNRWLGICWELSRLKPGLAGAPSFENFTAYDQATTALLAAVKRFAGKPQGWLTLYGPRGGGKSHMAEALARHLLSKRVPCLYIRAPELFPYLGAIARRDDDETDYAGRLVWMQRLPVLVIDELNKETRTDAVAQLRTNLLDSRWRDAVYNLNGATVLISNNEPDAWADPAIASRAMDSRFVQIAAPTKDYRRMKP
jgi:hypothetical protein